MIGLALSGGGSRAIAFHLGCLRALHDRGVLERVSVLSAVSGGAVVGALYAYSGSDFDCFDAAVVQLLRGGLQTAIVRNVLSPRLLLKILATKLVASPAAVAARVLRAEPPLRRWASRTDGLERALRSLYGNQQVSSVARPNLDVVINACELRTGTAFRFGNRRSGSWRFGEITGNSVEVAHAVACSAAYPLLLPPLDRCFLFERDGARSVERVVLTDGGVYDNLGLSCLDPGRDERHSLHTYQPEYLICCDAGQGQSRGNKIPFGFVSSTTAAMESVFRKAHDSALKRLHMHRQEGGLAGFALPYLGQMDDALPERPADLVRREDVVDYPTNFAAMAERDIELLSRRGEQLTRVLLAHYCP